MERTDLNISFRSLGPPSEDKHLTFANISRSWMAMCARRPETGDASTQVFLHAIAMVGLNIF